MTKPEESIAIHPRIPSDLLKRLDGWATRTRRSRNAAVLVAIEQLLEAEDAAGPVETRAATGKAAVDRPAQVQVQPIVKGKTR